MSEIVYPQGCRSVTEDLGPDELIRRLKVYVIKYLISILFLTQNIHIKKITIKKNKNNSY